MLIGSASSTQDKLIDALGTFSKLATDLDGDLFGSESATGRLSIHSLDAVANLFGLRTLDPADLGGDSMEDAEQALEWAMEQCGHCRFDSWQCAESQDDAGRAVIVSRLSDDEEAHIMQEARMSLEFRSFESDD